jgi:signal transduction histidine kinase
MRRFSFRVVLLLVLDVLLLATCLWHTKYLLNRPRVPFLLNDVKGSVVIDDVLDPGAASGLGSGFTVRTIDGFETRDYHDAEFLADFRSIGDTMEIRGWRSGEEITATVRLIPFFSLQYAIITIFIGIVTLATAIFVLLARPRDRAAKVLYAALACMGFSVMLMWGQVPRGDPWPIICRVGLLTFYLGAATNFLHFTFLFPRRSRDLTRTRAILIHVPAIVIGALALSTHLHALLNESLESYRLFQQSYSVYHATILVYGVLGVGNFIRSYRATESPDEQKKLQWLLWGLAIGPAPFLFLEILPELFIPLSPVPEEYTLIFLLVIPLAFAVSFVRYHILDVRVVINRTTVYGIVLTCFVLAYLGAVSLAAAIIGHYTVGASVVSAILVALGLEPMRRRVQRLVDRRFFRVRYDFRLAQREFVEEMKRHTTIVDLADLVIRQIQRLIPVNRVAFVLTPPEGGKTICLAEAPAGQVDQQPEFFQQVRNWLVEDVPYGIPEKIETGILVHAAEPAALESAGFCVVIPMFSGNNRLLGFLGLSGKKSGVRFSSEDIDLLRSIVVQAGLEIDRILLQREVFRKEVEAQRLRDLNELKSAVVHNVSHEFLTPLTAIRIHAEALEGRIGGKDAKGRESLATIEGEVGRLDKMVTSILDAARIERGVRFYDMRDVDLGAILRSVLKMMRYEFRKHRFDVRIYGLTPGKKYPVRVDEPAIAEALVNLTGNAIKYSPHRRVVAISLRADGRFWRCAVRDKGEGIPPDALQHIFERFYRAPASEKRVAGIGIGLSLVKEIVEAHGGRVAAESTPGKGSCFTLWIPRGDTRRGRDKGASRKVFKEPHSEG